MSSHNLNTVHQDSLLVKLTTLEEDFKRKQKTYNEKLQALKLSPLDDQTKLQRAFDLTQNQLSLSQEMTNSVENLSKQMNDQAKLSAALIEVYREPFKLSASSEKSIALTLYNQMMPILTKEIREGMNSSSKAATDQFTERLTSTVRDDRLTLDKMRTVTDEFNQGLDERQATYSNSLLTLGASIMGILLIVLAVVLGTGIIAIPLSVFGVTDQLGFAFDQLTGDGIGGKIAGVTIYLLAIVGMGWLSLRYTTS